MNPERDALGSTSYRVFAANNRCDLERVVVAEVLVAHVEADGASLATSAATRPAMCRRASVRILEMPTIAQQ